MGAAFSRFQIDASRLARPVTACTPCTSELLGRFDPKTVAFTEVAPLGRIFGERIKFRGDFEGKGDFSGGFLGKFSCVIEGNFLFRGKNWCVGQKGIFMGNDFEGDFGFDLVIELKLSDEESKYCIQVNSKSKSGNEVQFVSYSFQNSVLKSKPSKSSSKSESK